jgi:hypothetical protein
MDITGILVILLLAAGIGRYLSSDGTSRILDAIGAGITGYRQAGWPRGVQEGEPIPWRWSSMSDRNVRDRDPASDAGVEVIEIDGDAGAELTAIDHGRLSSGPSLRLG